MHARNVRKVDIERFPFRFSVGLRVYRTWLWRRRGCGFGELRKRRRLLDFEPRSVFGDPNVTLWTSLCRDDFWVRWAAAQCSHANLGSSGSSVGGLRAAKPLGALPPLA